MSSSPWPLSRPLKSCDRSGFTLIEMAVVIVIAGIIISIVATVLPSLIQTAKIKQARAILEKTDYALQGYLIANNRLPCPDSTGDGHADPNDGGDCSSYIGNIPYLSLGLSNGNDPWGNPIRYAVYGAAGGDPMIDLTNLFADAVTFCDNGLTLAANEIAAGDDGTAGTGDDGFISTKLYTTFTDLNDVPNPSTNAGQAYVLVSGGPKDLSAPAGFFDDLNDALDLQFDAPNKQQSQTYDDLIVARSVNYLAGRHCTGGGGGGSGGGGGGDCDGIESVYCGNCDDGEDNDNDGQTDCADGDCATHPNCVNPTCAIATASPLPSGEINSNYAVDFTASAGCDCCPCEWELLSDGGFADLYLHNYTGHLSGQLSRCPGTYTIQIGLTDCDTPPDTPQKSFTIEVIANLSIARTSGDGSVNITWDDPNQEETFEVNGGHLGDIDWTCNWDGATGFEVVSTGTGSCSIRKTGATAAGNFNFVLTGTDHDCPSNTALLNLSVSVPLNLAPPYFVNMEAEWRFDECTTWDGVSFDVQDTLEDLMHYGRAANGAMALFSGKYCRAAYFDGNDDKIVSDVLTGSDIMAFGSQVTLACWFKSPGGGGGSPRLIEFSNEAGDYQWSTALCYDSDGSLRAWVSDETTGARGGEIDYSIERYDDNAWHHAVYTYSPTNGGRLYVDSVLKQTRTDDPTNNIHDAETFAIGGYYPNNSHGFNGLIDEVMVFSRELDQGEVEGLYNLPRNTCPGDCYTGPLAEYRMENFPWQGDTNEVIDSSGNGHHGMAVGPTLPTQTTPSGGKVCRAGVFAEGYLDLDLSRSAIPQDATFMAWAMFEGSTSDGYRPIFGTASGGSPTFFVGKDNHHAYIGIRDGTYTPNMGADIEPGEWQHITYRKTGTTKELFVDGEKTTMTAPSGSITPASLAIGYEDRMGGIYWDGLIDEVRIYSRALAENEIRAAMAETGDCPSEAVIITTESIAGGPVNAPYSQVIAASGGATPYQWSSTSTMSLFINPNSGQLTGTLNACPGTHSNAVTVTVTDSNGSVDVRRFDIIVTDGGLSISPAPQTFLCDSSTWSQGFTVSGNHLGDIDWSMEWGSGNNPGGFEIVATGGASMTLRKIGASLAGTFYFTLAAIDSSCPSNTYTTPTSYQIDISGSGGDEPYYAGLVGEWRMDECMWNGTTGEVLDSSATGAHGEGHNVGAMDEAHRSTGRICRSSALNLGGVTNQYVTLGHEAFSNLGGFSLSLWFRIDSLSSDLNTLFSGATAGNANSMLIFLDSSGDPLEARTIITYVNGLSTGRFNIGFNAANGIWHHIVWTRSLSDGTEIVYLDGTSLVDTDADVSTENITLASGGAMIGQEQDSVGGGFSVAQIFHGWIDEVLVYGEVLSQAAVNTLYGLSRNCEGDCYTGPVAEYRMDETSWTLGTPSVLDASGNDYHGTPTGNAAINSGGHLCNGGEFSNSDGSIEITGLPFSNPQDGDKTTVCFWMNWAGGSGEMPVGWGSTYDLYLLGDSLGFNTGCSDVFGVAGIGSLSHSWHHVAGVFTNNAPEENLLYIDGQLQPMALLNGSFCNRSVSSSFYISGWNSGSGYKYDGLLDEVKIYARGLSSSEIAEDMNQTHVCP
ncbi:MAG: LamG-like jellyroll fold domain-containing protein [Thermodesulfobacteriota bacterium]|nr:LamG-like jellyroll fold domain-containing protein [Thermodesulfobacteriota bacterium]